MKIVGSKKCWIINNWIKKVKILLQKTTLLTLMLFFMTVTVAQTKGTDDNLIQVHKLEYLESEPGVDVYQVTMLVSDNKIRIDETGENSGYIVYDDVKKKIYSVSHQEESTLVINHHEFDGKNSPAKTKIEYQQLSDAPTVDGNSIFNYRVFTVDGDTETNCMEVQLAENLLPDVRVLLKNYQAVISGQQVKMTDNTISSQQTACFFVDQIYNTGAYYDKGFPIQEWHSNERSKILQSFKMITVDKKIFDVPETYNQFSIGSGLKALIN